MISPRIVPLAAVLALSVPLLPVAALADGPRSAVLQEAQELKAANDALQPKGRPVLVFGQSAPAFDFGFSSEQSALYGPNEPLTPSLGTSASFPARTYQPIPETQSTFGLSIRF